jgi:23S rRNA (adenine-N6)-dimethyltransferase
MMSKLPREKSMRSRRLTSRRISHSQNFLRSARLVETLVEDSSIGNDDVVYEIGPGKGIITRALARRAKAVVAIEADTELYARLVEHLSDLHNVTIHRGDFLQYRLPDKLYKVFANIPFDLSADIIRKLTDADVAPTEAYLIVQEQAAQKYAGTPYGRETLFSVLRRPWFEFSVVHRLNKWDFEPVPNVSAVLLRIKLRLPPLVSASQAALYRDFVAYGFTSLRPTLKKAFKHLFGHVEFLRLADELGFARSAKPTDLAFDQWLNLFKYFANIGAVKQAQVTGALRRLHAQQSRLQKVHRTRSAGNWRRSIPRH